jgi:hypothetical protein
MESAFGERAGLRRGLGLIRWGMSPVVLIVALVFGLVAMAHYVRALQRAEPRLVSYRRDDIPAQARRDYVLSLVYSCVFIIGIAILAYREGSRVVAVIFAGIALIGAAMTFARWLRARSDH